MGEVRIGLRRRSSLQLLGAGALTSLGWATLIREDALAQTLVEAARKEGALNIIGCPSDWANWGEIVPAFEKVSGIVVDSANPNGTSAEELQAIRSLKGQGRAPDVAGVVPPPDGAIAASVREHIFLGSLTRLRLVAYGEPKAELRADLSSEEAEHYALGDRVWAWWSGTAPRVLAREVLQ